MKQIKSKQNCNNPSSFNIYDKQSYPRPSQYLIQVGKEFPNIWKDIDTFIEKYNSCWPEWCFLPSTANIWNAKSDDGSEPTVDLSELQSAIPCLAAWRTTQGIFTFDNDVLEALWNTSIEGMIPTDVLDYLPHWCVYVDTGGRECDFGILRGFFAHRDYSVVTRYSYTDTMVVILDIQAQSGEDILLPFSFHKKSTYGCTPTIERVIALYMEKQSGWYLSTNGSMSEKEAFKSRFKSGWEEILPGVFSLLLALCNENGALKKVDGDFELPKPPSPKKTKKGLRYYPPNQPTAWEGAWRIGAAIRVAKHELNGSDQCGNGKKIRACIRRAHWHSYWTGPMFGERKIIVKWLQPTFINVDSPRDLIPVVCNVDCTQD